MEAERKTSVRRSDRWRRILIFSKSEDREKGKAGIDGSFRIRGGRGLRPVARSSPRLFSFSLGFFSRLIRTGFALGSRLALISLIHFFEPLGGLLLLGIHCKGRGDCEELYTPFSNFIKKVFWVFGVLCARGA
jgi:hypothetical protein